MEKNLKAGIFIIPNGIYSLEEHVRSDRKYLKQIETFFPGWKPEKNEKVVEVWVHDLDRNEENYSDNWSCHGKAVKDWDSEIDRNLKDAEDRGDVLCEKSIISFERIYGRWPRVIPVSILLGMKEGDTISCKFKGKVFELKADQLKTRYSRYGKFETILTLLLERYRKIYEEG